MANGDLSATAKEIAKMGEKVRLTEARRNVLRVFAEGGGPGESWAQYFDGMSSSALAWANHERMLDALAAAGLLDDNGITDAGRAALASKDPTP